MYAQKELCQGLRVINSILNFKELDRFDFRSDRTFRTDYIVNLLRLLLQFVVYRVLTNELIERVLMNA